MKNLSFFIIKPMQYLFVFVLLISSLTACKTQVIGLQQHPSFTYQSTLQTQFVVAGVVSSVAQLDDITRIRLGDLLARTFQQRQAHIRIIRTGFVFKALGEQAFTKLLDDYQLTAVIKQDEVLDLRNAFPNARYVMLARIEKNQINHEHDETETDVADSEKDRQAGEYEQIRVDVSLQTSRSMGASLLIYDLKDHVTVWSGYVEKSDYNSNDSSHTFTKDKRWQEELLETFVDSLIGLDNGSYPEAPTRQDVLESIFEGFAENMPEAKK